MKIKYLIVFLVFCTFITGLFYLNENSKGAYNVANEKIYKYELAKEMMLMIANIKHNDFKDREKQNEFYLIKTKHNKGFLYVYTSWQSDSSYIVKIKKQYNRGNTTYIILEEKSISDAALSEFIIPTLMTEINVNNKIVVKNTDGKIYKMVKKEENTLKSEYENNKKLIKQDHYLTQIDKKIDKYGKYLINYKMSGIKKVNNETYYEVNIELIKGEPSKKDFVNIYNSLPKRKEPVKITIRYGIKYQNYQTVWDMKEDVFEKCESNVDKMCEKTK